MIDDLVKRLHKGPLRDDYETAVTMSEAADRIEKLEAALLDLSDGYECCPVSQAMRRVARKALEGKDET